MLKSGLIVVSLFMGLSTFAKPAFITTDDKAVNSFNRHVNFLKKVSSSRSGVSVYKLDEKNINLLSHEMHHQHNRCGGFFFHDSQKDAESFIRNSSFDRGVNKSFVDYRINKEEVVNTAMAGVKALNIQSTIEKLQSYKNRYYKSATGVKALEYIHGMWSKIVVGRSDATVEYHKHSWKQPSVILTIKGSEKADEVIVIGGHADSIAGFIFQSYATAPGADDNASGISTITEVLRVLADMSYQPKRTIKFMAYAAEEVGLRGSKEIARLHKDQGAKVIGVMQLDMTNYKGSSEEIILINDFTNQAQNKFLGQLIDKYLGVSWAYSKCGYACSDHASWTSQGYPASFPHEAKFKDSNKRIHTAGDTLEVSNGNADHASNFAKLAVAFIVELDQ